MFLAAGSHLEFADVLVGFFGRRCRLKLGFSNKFSFTAFPHSGLRPQARPQRSTVRVNWTDIFAGWPPGWAAPVAAASHQNTIMLFSLRRLLSMHVGPILAGTLCGVKGPVGYERRVGNAGTY